MAIQTKYFAKPIVVKRQRPKAFSDPCSDYHEPYPTKLLETPDHLLGYQELRAILGPHITAGTYEEVAYFLPLAYDRVWAEQDIAWDLIRSIVWYISEYADELQADHVLDSCRAGVFELLTHWTSDFCVQHHDRAACSAKGWTSDDEDYVRHSNIVCICTSSLFEFRRHQDIALDFCNYLLDSLDRPVSAAWLLELWRAQGDFHPPSADPQVTVCINNLEALTYARKVLGGSVIVSETSSPTYWRDQFTAIDSMID